MFKIKDIANATEMRVGLFLVATIATGLLLVSLWHVARADFQHRLTEHVRTAYDATLQIADRANRVERARMQWLADALARCVGQQPVPNTEEANASNERLCTDRILDQVGMSAPTLAHAFAVELMAAGVAVSSDWKEAGAAGDALQSHDAVLPGEPGSYSP
ncbi:hypothetical protein [Dolichospermum phage Dfl-JY45]